MKLSILCASLLSCCAGFGQSPTQKLAFEVASIKPAPPSPMNQLRVGMGADAGMLRYSNVSLKDCIRVAYRVKDFQVQGPDWLGNTRFDIVAKLPDGSSEDQIPEMLQTLLADRFKLVVHRDSKEHAIYALVAGKGGPKLKPAEMATADVTAPAGNGGRGVIPRGGMTVMVDDTGAHLQAPSATLPRLAELMSRFAERPIVDMSGIEGQYDFDLVLSPEALRGVQGGGRQAGPPPADGAGPSATGGSEGPGSIFEAVQRYGLKLEPRKAQMDVLIVDQMEKAPTAN
jgi:uncharacterized protein (TIGR03435 family)